MALLKSRSEHPTDSIYSSRNTESCPPENQSVANRRINLASVPSLLIEDWADYQRGSTLISQPMHYKMQDQYAAAEFSGTKARAPLQTAQNNYAAAEFSGRCASWLGPLA